MTQVDLRKEDDVRLGMDMWHKYAMFYRTDRIKYQFYVSMGQIMVEVFGAQSKKIQRISADVSRTYPEIPFLEILSEEEARAYLEDTSRPLRLALVYNLSNLPYNHAFNTVRSTILKFEDYLQAKGVIEGDDIAEEGYKPHLNVDLSAAILLLLPRKQCYRKRKLL